MISTDHQTISVTILLMDSVLLCFFAGQPTCPCLPLAFLSCSPIVSTSILGCNRCHKRQDHSCKRSIR